MFLLISSGRIGGVSIQSFTKVREAFRQITQKLWGHKDLRLGQIV